MIEKCGVMVASLAGRSADPTISRCIRTPETLTVEEWNGETRSFWYYLSLSDDRWMEAHIRYSFAVGWHQAELMNVRELSSGEYRPGLEWNRWLPPQTRSRELPPEVNLAIENKPATLDELRHLILRHKGKSSGTASLRSEKPPPSRDDIVVLGRDNVAIVIKRRLLDRLSARFPKIRNLSGRIEDVLRTGDAQPMENRPDRLRYSKQIGNTEMEAYVEIRDVGAVLQDVAVIDVDEIVFRDRRGINVRFSRFNLAKHIVKHPGLGLLIPHLTEWLERPAVIVREAGVVGIDEFHLYLPLDLQESLFHRPSIGGWWKIIVGYEQGTRVRAFVKSAFPDDGRGLEKRYWYQISSGDVWTLHS